MSKSPIEWTEETWNPVVGCSIVSPGCTNCYAMQMAARCEAMGTSRYDGTTKRVNGKIVWTGKLARAPEATLLRPLRRKKPTMYFVNSMSDLFHEDCPDEWIDQVFAVMALCPQHTFQVLTKRAKRMREYLTARNGMGNAAICKAINAIPSALGNRHGALEMPLPNVWLGTSTERQQEADERIPLLLQTPAAVRFISAEPLLGPLNLFDYIGPWGPTPQSLQAPPELDWVIVGGESGPKARPSHPDWHRSLRDQCAAAGVPFFFKQFGEWGMPTDTLGEVDWPYHPDHDRTHWFDRRTCARPIEQGWSEKYHGGGGALRPPPFDLWKTPEYLDQVARCPQANCREARKCTGNAARAAVTRVGKKRAGRLLDGVEHNAMPRTVA